MLFSHFVTTVIKVSSSEHRGRLTLSPQHHHSPEVSSAERPRAAGRGAPFLVLRYLSQALNGDFSFSGYDCSTNQKR